MTTRQRAVRLAAAAAVGLALIAVALWSWRWITSSNDSGDAATIATAMAAILTALVGAGVATARIASRGVTVRPLGVPLKDALEKDPTASYEVHRAIEAGPTGVAADSLPLYIERAHDRALQARMRDAQQRSQIVVLVGSSSTGKTRACWEALMTLRQQRWRLWHPLSPDELLAGLSGIDAAGLRPRTVVWLNELQRYLLPSNAEVGRTVAEALRELMRDAGRGPVLVLGTIWPDRWALLSHEPRNGQPDPYEQARALLSGSAVVVPETLNESERQAVRQAADHDPRWAQVVKQSPDRPVQFLAGGLALLQRYETAGPQAKAVLDAAGDARRMNGPESFTVPYLEQAARGYLPDVVWQDLPLARRDSWVREVIEAELSRPQRGIPGPLYLIRHDPQAGVITDGPRYQLADYLEQHLRRARVTVQPKDSLWEADVAAPDVLAALADSAGRRRRFGHAASLSRRCAAIGDASGLSALAARLAAEQQWEDAKQLAGEAAAVGDGSGLSRVAASLASKQRWEDAERLAREAAAAGDPSGLSVVAGWMASSKRWRDAKRLAREAAAAGDGSGLSSVAGLLAEEQRWEDAELLAREAAAAGDGSGLSSVAASLPYEQWWLAVEPRWEDAKRLARDAAKAGDGSGLSHVAESLAHEQRWEEAEGLAREAAAAGDPSGLCRVASVLAQAERWEDAERLAREAAAAGDPSGLSEVASPLAQAQRWEDAERLAREAAAAGAPSGLSNVAILLSFERWEDAEQLAREAAAAGAPFGLCDLAEWLAEEQQWEDAEQLAREAAAAGYPFGLSMLTDQLAKAQRWQDAERLAQEATAAGAPLALHLLRLLGQPRRSHLD